MGYIMAEIFQENNNMKYLSEHFKELEKRGNYPEEAIKALEETASKIDGNKKFAAAFEKLRLRYMNSNSERMSNRNVFILLDKLAKKYKVNEYTLHLVFLIVCSELLHKRYKAKGISDEIFWRGVDDFRCKMLECMACKHVPGTFVETWNWGFMHMNRFALGRFQYEYDDADFDFTTKAGVHIKKGQQVINFHIPSSGIPLTDDIRLDSYKKAYEFFKDQRTPDGYLILRCGSWLLFPGHEKMLFKDSNILRFYRDFEIYKWEERDNFGDDWRIWNADAQLPLEQRPADTKLRKAYKDWMTAGNKTGYGCGVIVFDGEKIVR